MRKGPLPPCEQLFHFEPLSCPNRQLRWLCGMQHLLQSCADPTKLWICIPAHWKGLICSCEKAHERGSPWAELVWLVSQAPASTWQSSKQGPSLGSTQFQAMHVNSILTGQMASSTCSVEDSSVGSI